ncbi:DUF7532 family protein [Natronorarus salvus]|uniref:DUF7532 family protein n=1 Tax=Natronorarus salvus TaxID=3117733 RepID=UPI002F26236A
MHFDGRTQRAFREAGVDRETVERVADRVVELAREDAERVEGFFGAHDRVVSDMDLAHSSEEFPEHTVDYCDLFTHGAEIRGYLRFDSWGVPVEDVRVLVGEALPDVVECTLGPTVNGRVRFSTDRERL